MKYKKATLTTIIILLVICLPASIYGLLNKGNDNNKVIDNPNHEFKLNNHLFYYSEAGDLLGTYECQTDNCGNIKTIIDDDNYKIDYYKYGTVDELSSYDEDYAFLQDGEQINFYSFGTKSNVALYQAFKNYNTNLQNNLIIAKKNNKWGVQSLVTKAVVINFEYDFIGLKNSLDSEDKLNTDTFIVLKDNNWYLASDNELITVAFTKPIKSFTTSFIVTNDNEIYDYQGNVKTESSKYKDIYVVNDYIIAISETNIAVVYNNSLESNITYTQLDNYTDLSFKFTNNKIEVYDAKALKQTIEIS